MEYFKITLKKIKCIALLVILIFTFNGTLMLHLTKSQFEYFPGYIGLACLFPFQGSENLSLIDSNIIMKTQFQEGEFVMPITFDCSYNVFNPDNSVNVTFALPFSYDLYYGASESSFVNGTEVELEEVDYTLARAIIDKLGEYIDEYFGYEYMILNNIELQGNSNSLIRIIVETNLGIPLGRESKVLYIFYDVESINVWNLYVDKKVEFLVNGSQPLRYANYSDTTPERKCLVTTYDYGASYLWNWEHESIIEKGVYVEWLIPRDKSFTFLVNWDFNSILLFFISSTLIVFVNRYRRKRCLHE